MPIRLLGLKSNGLVLPWRHAYKRAFECRQQDVLTEDQFHGLIIARIAKHGLVVEPASIMNEDGIPRLSLFHTFYSTRKHPGNVNRAVR